MYVENSIFHHERTSRGVPVSDVHTSQTAFVFWAKHDPNAVKLCVVNFKVYVENSSFHNERTSRAVPVSDVSSPVPLAFFGQKMIPSLYNGA